MRSWRVVLLSVGLVTSFLAAGATSAEADEASSICSISSDAVLGSSASVIGIRIQAFDCNDRPLPFTGTVRLATFDPWPARTAAPTSESPPATITSTTGEVAVTLVDVAAMDEGQAEVIPDLSVPGEAGAYEGIDLADPVIPVSKDRSTTNQPFDGATHAASPVPTAYMRFQQAQWGCDAILLSDASCVLSTRTTADRSWEQGYKLTVTWPDPGTDAGGRPYTRCKVWPRVGLLWHDPSDPNPISTLGYSVVLDVPADWGSTTLPLGAASFPNGVVPGRTTIDVDYSCYRMDKGHRQGTAQPRVVSDELIPDVPPSRPSEIAVEPDGTDLHAEADGSVARGAAPVLGYEMTVVGEDGTAVGSDRIPVMALPGSRGMSAATGQGGAVHTFQHLAAGRYTVRVAAYNAIGTSETVLSRTVSLTAPVPQTGSVPQAGSIPQTGSVPQTGSGTTSRPVPVRTTPELRAPRRVKAAVRHRRLHVTWRAPSATGGGITRYRVSVWYREHLLQRRTLHSSSRAFDSKRLRAGRTYRVVVLAAAGQGRTASSSRGFTVRR